MYIVTELCEGGELFDVLETRGKLREEDAAQVVKQVLTAMQHLTAKHIVHRDLKLENLLLEKKFLLKSIKVIDFGLAAKDTTRNLTGLKGTD